MKNVTHQNEQKGEGQLLKEKIESFGFSPEDVANKIGLTKSTLYSYFKKDKLKAHEYAPVVFGLYSLKNELKLDFSTLNENIQNAMNVMAYAEVLKLKEDHKNITTQYEKSLITISRQTVSMLDLMDEKKNLENSLDANKPKLSKDGG